MSKNSKAKNQKKAERDRARYLKRKAEREAGIVTGTTIPPTTTEDMEAQTVPAAEPETESEYEREIDAITGLEKKVNQLENEKSGCMSQIRLLERDLKEAKEKIDERDKGILELKAQFKKQDETLEEAKKNFATIEKAVEGLESDLKERDSRIEELKNRDVKNIAALKDARKSIDDSSNAIRSAHKALADSSWLNMFLFVVAIGELAYILFK